MNKKIISSILAGACALSAMSISAFADSLDLADQKDAELTKAGAKSYSISAGFQAPALDVTIPSAMKAVLNPYGVKVELDEGFTGTDGITSPVYTIANNTEDFGIIVKATASASVPTGSEVTINTSTTDPSGTLATDTAKQVWAQLKATIDATDESTMTAITAPIIFKESGAVPQQLLVLKKAADSKTPEKGYFQIGGCVSGKPAKAWTTADKVTLNLILDIEPANDATAVSTTVGDGT